MNQAAPAQVTLCHAGRIEEIFACDRQWSKTKWAYFGEDYQQALLLKQKLSTRGASELDCRAEIAAGVIRYKQEFIDLIGELGKTQPEDDWLVSSIAEKPMGCTLLPDACRAIFAAGNLSDRAGEDDLLLVVARDGLLEVLKGIFPHAQVYAQLAWRRHLHQISSYICAGINALRKEIVLRCYYHRSQLPRADVIIRSWLDARSFNAAGEFCDPYFGALAETLRNKGYRVAWLLSVLHPRSAKRLAVLQKQGLAAATYQQATTITDSIRRFLAGCFRRPLRFNEARIAGIDIRPLLREMAVDDVLRMGYSAVAIEEDVVKHMAQAAIRPQRMIFPLENQPWERILCRAVRRHLPGCVTVGYQHSVVIPDHLLYCPAQIEREYMPQPDEIMTVGETAREYLARYGYRSRIAVGGAWRYPVTAPSTPAVNHGWLLLVALPYHADLAFEMASKVLAFAVAHPGRQVVMKPHPCTPLPKELTGAVERMPNIRLNTTPIGQLLAQATVLLYAESSVCLEAMLCNVPIVCYNPEYRLANDPLADMPHLRVVVSKMDELDRDDWKALPGAAEYASQYFSSANAAAAGRFVGESA